jgi:hypothetical protein
MQNSVDVKAGFASILSKTFGLFIVDSCKMEPQLSLPFAPYPKQIEKQTKAPKINLSQGNTMPRKRKGCNIISCHKICRNGN